MKAEKLEATLGSIRKWQRIVRRTTAVDHGAFNCPLCTLFLERDCRGCPVSEATGVSGCRGSPYELWNEHMDECNHHYHRTPGCKECLRLAKAELTFLVGLLPDKDKKQWSQA